MAHTDKLAAGHEELRSALTELVREALARGWVDEKRQNACWRSWRVGMC